MSLPNYPDSLNDVITTVTHSLLVFEDVVRQEMPECAVVYDEDLSYESALRTLVAKGNYDNADLANLPIFIYNRSILRKNDWGIGGRADSYDATLRLPSGGTVVYTPLNGAFDINFLFVSKSIQAVEQFEVVFLSDEGISNTKELKVDMGDLGLFTYYMDFANEMTDKPIVKEEVYYKGVGGSLTVRGFFFTFRANAGIIKEINQKIYALRGGNLEINKATFAEDLPTMEKELLATDQIE